MMPWSRRLANRRRTVVRELRFKSRTCFSVRGRCCSSAYPISIKISKSTIDLTNGSWLRSNSLILRSAENNFMFFCNEFNLFAYSVGQSIGGQEQLGSFLAHTVERSPESRRAAGEGMRAAKAIRLEWIGGPNVRVAIETRAELPGRRVTISARKFSTRHPISVSDAPSDSSVRAM
jgi:hypothetical protein